MLGNLVAVIKEPLQEKSREQSRQSQQVLLEERVRHEQSENRWVKLIDVARQESKDLQSSAAKLAEANGTEIKSLNQNISGLQQKLFEKEILIRDSLASLEALKQEILALKAGKLTQKAKK